MPQSKFKTIKYTGKASVLSFWSQFFQTVVRWKKRYISMAKVRRSVLKLHI